EVRAGIVEVLATNGDTRLGGDDLDVRLADLLLAELPPALAAHPQARAQVLAMAERAKRALTEASQTDLELVTPDGKPIRRTVRREEFEALVRDIVERTGRPCRQALKDAALDAGPIGEGRAGAG